MTSRFDILAIDCRDPRALADFWCAVLGYVIVDVDDDGVSIADRALGADQGPRPGTPPPGIDFFWVPEGKTVKNRLHLDLRAVGATQEAELARLLELGAREIDVGQARDVTWVVLADPEGNEFCLLRTPVPADAAARADPHGPRACAPLGFVAAVRRSRAGAWGRGRPGRVGRW